MAESEEGLKSILMKVKEVTSWLKAQHSENEDHGIWSHHFMANRWGKMETVRNFIFLGSRIIADSDCGYEINRHLLLGRKPDKTRQHIKKKRHYFANKGPSSQGYGFSSGHVWM